MNAPIRSRRSSSQSPGYAPNEAARLAMAELALSLSLAGGADYADIRLGATLRERLRARDERLETAWTGESWGFGLRVLRRGSWGFCGIPSLTEEAIRRGVETALVNARAVAPIQGAPIALEALPVVEDRWEMALGIDPFATPIAKKADFLLAANAAARDAGADFCTSHFTAAREERLFANSRGSAHLAEPHAGLARVRDRRRRQGERAFCDARQPDRAARRGLGLCRSLRLS